MRDIFPAAAADPPGSVPPHGSSPVPHPVCRQDPVRLSSINSVDRLSALLSYVFSNKQLFLNIDLITEAIDKGKQISFNYTRHYFDERKKAEQEDKEYIINPYFMVNNQGKYYLVCNYDYFDSIANYKVEQIKNLLLE